MFLNSNAIFTMRYFNKKVINWNLILQVFFTTFLPNYVIVSYSVKPMMDLNKSFLEFLGIEYDNVVFTVFFIIFIFIVPFIVHNIKWFQTETNLLEENKFLKRIMHGISTVVDNKKNRFHKSKNKNLEKSGAYFQEITQPEMQIANICTTVANIFKSLTDENKIKLTLISCKEKHLSSYSYMSDESSSVDILDLDTHTSTAREAMRKQKMYVIEDVERIKKENPFWKAPNSKIKSLIAYPICCGGTTVFVLCIAAKTARTFKEEESKRYSFLLEEFSQRILLESYLLEIRNKCTDIA